MVAYPKILKEHHMRKTKCPACKKIIQLQDDTKVQDLVTCPYCKSILEFTRDFPPTLDWAEDPIMNSPFNLNIGEFNLHR
jgi:DNA-directed RNA polymerase subunit RPC12/RpoP